MSKYIIGFVLSFALLAGQTAWAKPEVSAQTDSGGLAAHNVAIKSLQVKPTANSEATISVELENAVQSKEALIAAYSPIAKQAQLYKLDKKANQLKVVTKSGIKPAKENKAVNTIVTVVLTHLEKELKAGTEVPVVLILSDGSALEAKTRVS